MTKSSVSIRCAVLAQLLGVSLLLLALAVGTWTVSPAYAQAPKGKVSVCHKTGSATNPWVFQTIDVNAVPAHMKNGDIIGVKSAADCPKAQPETAVEQGTVGVCHQTGSATNPWVFQTIDVDAVDAHLQGGDIIDVSSQSDCPQTLATGTTGGSAAIGTAGGSAAIGATGGSAPVGLPNTGGAPMDTGGAPWLGVSLGALLLLLLGKIVSRRAA